MKPILNRDMIFDFIKVENDKTKEEISKGNLDEAKGRSDVLAELVALAENSL